MLTRLSVPPQVMPVVETRASLVPGPLSLITVVPANAMLPMAEMAPMAFWPVVMPSVVLVPAGERTAPDETVKLPLTWPMPARV